MKRKILSAVLACLMLCGMMAPAALAAEAAPAPDEVVSAAAPRASNWFSGGTGTLNTMGGKPSKYDPVSSGSVPAGALVTNVEVSVTVSRGSIPFYLVVVAPSGEKAERYISASGRVEFDEFSKVDINPKGTWTIYIYNTGVSFTDVSTASARMTVTYSY